jgi:hypothetical protein
VDPQVLSGKGIWWILVNHALCPPRLPYIYNLCKLLFVGTLKDRFCVKCIFCRNWKNVLIFWESRFSQELQGIVRSWMLALGDFSKVSSAPAGRSATKWGELKFDMHVHDHATGISSSQGHFKIVPAASHLATPVLLLVHFRIAWVPYGSRSTIQLIMCSLVMCTTLCDNSSCRVHRLRLGLFTVWLSV